jgi:hypothetical protein
MDSTSSTQLTPKKPTNAINWAILVVILVAAVAAAIYAFTKTNPASNRNGNDNTNIVLNQNVNNAVNGNANQNVNVSTNQNVNSAINENTNTPSNTNAAGNINTNTVVNSNTNTNIDTSGWKTYTNVRYGYSFLYPSTAIVNEVKKQDFSLSLDEQAQGLTFDEVYTTYTGKICVTVQYLGIGYIDISAPANDGAAHVICGRTGVGTTLTTTDRQEIVTIDGRGYTMTGHEFVQQAPNVNLANALNYHNETLDLTLSDKTRIEVGSSPSDTINFNTYQNARAVLLTIVQSYKKL